jgi:hypothetical protein
VVDPEMGPVITEAFAMRARGDSYGAILDTIPRRIAKSTLAAVFTNRAYLGEARGPHGAVKIDAHPALTTEAIFRRVQPGKAMPRTGTTSGGLMQGIIYCSGCGHRLSLVSSADRQGNRRPSYACRIHHSDGDCSAPAVALVELVDTAVKDRLSECWIQVTAGRGNAEEAWLAAKKRVGQAESALDAWVTDTTIQQSLSRKRFQEGIIQRQREVEDAQEAMWGLPDPGLDEDLMLKAEDGELFQVLGVDLNADRRLYRRLIRRVELAKADPKRRRWQPVPQRVTVEFVGGLVAPAAPSS